MEVKQISISFEKIFAENVEKILDDIGLDFQSAINMFFKRIVKDMSVSFLLKTPDFETQALNNISNNHLFNEKANDYIDEFIEEKNFIVSRRSNKEINEEMRDYIWLIFTQNKKASYAEYQEIAKKVAQKTGMNQGSAYIYFIILSCLIEGKYNTRTMKFVDLVYYVKRIKQEYSSNEFIATIKSLESSVPYWEKRIPGRFSQKVQNLINHYKEKSMKKNIDGYVDNEEKSTYINKPDFEKYLIRAGYSQYTPSGNPSTVYDYIKRIDKVCQYENITWNDLPEYIDRLLVEYDVGGIKESRGAESHNAVISALKQLNNYIKNNNLMT